MFAGVVLLTAGAVLIGVGFGLPVIERLGWTADAPPVRIEMPSSENIAIVLDTKLQDISEDDARRINASRQVEVAKVPAAKPFGIVGGATGAKSLGAAAYCLTQAVYYEAASESGVGQRAVAQVVLNRVRHPAFPHSVCGVVYQGSERTTGCQFSFTCDGSLRRIPSVSGWARARAVALAALNGWVEPSVGTSTHYHADYVLPYWASSLDKVRTIGVHIFYRMRGGLGNPSIFAARYAQDSEFVPRPNLVALADPSGAASEAAPASPQQAAGEPSPLREDELGQGLIATKASGLSVGQNARLRADENSGSLVEQGRTID